MDHTKAVIAQHVRNLLLEHPVPGCEVSIITDLKTRIRLNQDPRIGPRYFEVTLKESY